MTEFEQYLVDKKWEYSDVGSDNVRLTCPWCGADDKFFFNTENGLSKCMKATCEAEEGRNFYQLRKHMGDPVQRKRGTVITENQLPDDDGVMSTKKKKTPEPIPNIEQFHQWLLESQETLDYLYDVRGWSHDTIVKNKIGLAGDVKFSEVVDDEGNKIKDSRYAAIVYPYFENDKCTFVKYRTAPGEPRGFRTLSGGDCPLYNGDAISEDWEYVVCAEGEADVLSLLSIGETNVVGVPGANQKKITWIDDLMKPRKRILMFDNDVEHKDGNVGQIHAKKFAERLGISEFYNLVVPAVEMDEPKIEEGKTRKYTKDISEWLATGKTLTDFHALLKTAKKFSIDGVYNTRDLRDEIVKEFAETGLTSPPFDTPWESLHEIFPGGERGQMLIILAPEKHLKTTWAVNLLMHLAGKKSEEKEGYNCFLDCCEMTKKDLTKMMLSNLTHVPFKKGPGCRVTTEIIDSGFEQINNLGGDIYTAKSDSESVEKYEEWLKSVIRRYDIDVVAFDNLQAMTDRLHSNERHGNRASFMSKITKMFKRVAMDTNVFMVLIAQTRQVDGDDMATASKLEGSSSPSKDCDYLMVFNRRKQNPDMSKSTAAKIGNVKTEETYTPHLFVNLELTRFGSGGMRTLWSEGDICLIRDIKDSDNGVTPAPEEPVKTAVASRLRAKSSTSVSYEDDVAQVAQF